jgi:hypothetical protein
LYFNMYSPVCLMESSLQSSIYRPSLLAVFNAQCISYWRSCRGSVAREAEGVKGFRANLQLMQFTQWYFPVISSALATNFRQISKALRPTCARRRCRYSRFSALCRDECPGVYNGSKRLTLSISVNSVDS